jgi:threonine/homoserine/homoserine lactone efflux protein
MRLLAFFISLMSQIRDFFTELFKLFKPFLLAGVIIGILFIICAMISMAADAITRRRRKWRMGFEESGENESNFLVEHSRQRW